MMITSLNEKQKNNKRLAKQLSVYKNKKATNYIILNYKTVRKLNVKVSITQMVYIKFGEAVNTSPQLYKHLGP